MSLAVKAALLGAFAATALAHGTVTGYTTDGKYNQGYLLQYYYAIQNGQTPPSHSGWYAEDLDNGFVQPDSYAKADIICHKNAKPATEAGTIAAGGKVGFQWTAWPESHIGPVLTYVAKVDGEWADIDKTTLKWVKIDQAGYDSSSKSWAAVNMIANNNTWETTVPSSLAAGKYVFRHEIIALHGAGSENGAQNYPQCVNIEVTGSGTENPAGTLGTALYKSTDPGILFNPYTTFTSYNIPGPALWGSGSPGNGNSSPSPAPSTQASSAAITSAPAVTAPPTTLVSVTKGVVVTTIATTVVEVDPTPTPSATPGTGNGNSNGDGSSDTLPEKFTIEQFITWLQSKAGSSSSKGRRHVRSF